MSNDTSVQTPVLETSTPVLTLDPTVPAYEAVTRAFAGLLASSPVTVTENKNFLKIESKVNGHKCYIAKQKVKVPRIETTTDLRGIEGYEPLPADKPNGKIAGTIVPELLGMVLEVMSDPGVKLRAALPRKTA